MIGVALFAVLVFAKTSMLNDQALSASPWAPVAYFWQDAVVSVLLGAASWTMRRRRWSPPPAIAYWLLVAYAAVNIPVGRALATPLTSPMMSAAGGPLMDSLLLYFTWTNVLLIGVTLALGVALPRLLRQIRVPRRAGAFTIAGALLLIALGPIASNHVETNGFDRNVVVALVDSSLPQAPRAGGPPGHDWRRPLAGSDGHDDQLGLRGAAAGRHVVVIGLESTGARYLAPWGSGVDVMPALTALTGEAVLFEHAYAVYPESIKGLFSILCSIAPAFDIDVEAYRHIRCPALPRRLADAGYRTAMFHSGRFAYLGMPAVIEARGYHTLEDAGHIGGKHESSFGIDEAATVARMLSWIDARARGERFFLTYLPVAGHHPYESPLRVFPTSDEPGRYRNALRYGDQALASLIAGFKARGLYEQTVWLIYGDHGEAFGQHAGNFGHTFMLYDENVHVPLVIAAPGLIGAGRRVPRVVSLVDTAPTVLDLLGLSIPEAYEGRSMLAAEPRMALFFTDYSRPMAGLRDGRWKFVYELDRERGRLFDLSSDPAERHDVSSHHAGHVAHYAGVVKGWAAAQKTKLTLAAQERRDVQR